MKALEIFKSHQGEGKYTGTLMLFIRFKVCKRPFSDVHCPFCDTMTKMTSCIEMSFNPKDLRNSLRDANYNICFTGGEPTIYMDAMKEIIDEFTYDINSHSNSKVHVETNGFKLIELYNMIKETELNDDAYFIAYSPKFFNEEECNKHIQFTNDNEKEILSNNTTLKIVVGENNEKLARGYLNGLNKVLLPLVYLMPMGVTENEIKDSMPIVSKLSMEFKVNISDRLHIIHTFM